MSFVERRYFLSGLRRSTRNKLPVDSKNRDLVEQVLSTVEDETLGLAVKTFPDKACT
jgi:hypothetical protein